MIQRFADDALEVIKWTFSEKCTYMKKYGKNIIRNMFLMTMTVLKY